MSKRSIILEPPASSSQVVPLSPSLPRAMALAAGVATACIACMARAWEKWAMVRCVAWVAEA